MSGAEFESVECGTEMDLERSWTESSIPVIGSDVEYREYTCSNCGRGVRFKRKEGEEDWQRASV